MKYLLDTNIVSEMQKSNCNQKVRVFTDGLPLEDMFICTLSIGEICFGIERLPPGKKKHELSLWLYTQLPEWFKGRVISLDTEVMLEWGRLRSRTGRTLPVADSLFAAAAITHHLTILTRNIKDFADIPGLNAVNPWET
ncbi:ribonuclease VapC [Spirochaetia bacterium]|nr:ribonuclease VapC [Spirochaetia bacterium]